jgi:hypothetical protein
LKQKERPFTRRTENGFRNECDFQRSTFLQSSR